MKSLSLSAVGVGVCGRSAAASAGSISDSSVTMIGRLPGRGVRRPNGSGARGAG